MKRREYRKRARADSEALTRQKILEAAVEVFSATPLERVTLGELAAHAGVSVPTLLRVHGSKEELFLSAVRVISGEVLSRRDSVDPQNREAALRVLVDDYETWDRATERLARQAEHIPEIAALFEEWRLFHRRWVQRGFADELERVGRSHRQTVLALLVVALDQGTYRRLRAEGLSKSGAMRAMDALTSAVLDRWQRGQT